MTAVWITGASSGIGEACAYRYAAEGAKLILTSSSAPRLECVAEKAARIITRAIDKGKREVLVGRKELLMVYIKRFFPGLCARLARKIKPM